MSKRKGTMQFVGAAQQPAHSFMELASNSLELYCPNWNNTSTPSSYIFPPTFSFKNPDKSDGDIDLKKKELEETKKNGDAKQDVLSLMERPIIDRWSDQGEFDVYKAIWTLLQENIQAPILAFHNLNLENQKHHLKKIFPNAQVDIQEKFKDMMREYDFILIGPKIGMIVVEVKSSGFTKARDFASARNLPDQIIDGVKQLQSFDPEFFHVCSGVQFPAEVQVRRILITPNLEKSRVNGWQSNLDNKAKTNVDKWLLDSKVKHWYKEDLANSVNDSSKPALYIRVKQMIQANGFQVPQEIYESYGLVIAGLASALVIPNQPISIKEIKISASCAILRGSASLESHDPLQKLKLNSSGSKEVVDLNSKLVLLTPEQQSALRGPNRQFIIGAAGTGKTIILQAKALQLLKEGKRILVCSAKCYWEKYEKLFEDWKKLHLFEKQRFSSYEIREELFWGDIHFDSSPIDFLNILNAAESWGSLKFPEIDKPPDWLTDFDAVLMDDTFDKRGYFHNLDESRSLSVIMLLMTIARSREFRSKVVWIAGDPCLADSKDDIYKQILSKLIGGKQGHYFSCSTLNRIMRSSESVFQAACTESVMKLMPIKPILGHKIHGYAEVTKSWHTDFTEALSESWEHVFWAVKQILGEGFNYGHMTVIVGGDDQECTMLNDYLTAYLSSALTITTWDNVSSLEWPVVIYAAMLTVRSDEDGIKEAYRRYRACSRAIMKLFEIVTYIKESANGSGAKECPYLQGGGQGSGLGADNGHNRSTFPLGRPVYPQGNCTSYMGDNKQTGARLNSKPIGGGQGAGSGLGTVNGYNCLTPKVVMYPQGKNLWDYKQTGAGARQFDSARVSSPSRIRIKANFDQITQRYCHNISKLTTPIDRSPPATINLMDTNTRPATRTVACQTAASQTTANGTTAASGKIATGQAYGISTTPKYSTVSTSVNSTPTPTPTPTPAQAQAPASNSREVYPALTVGYLDPITAIILVLVLILVRYCLRWDVN